MLSTSLGSLRNSAAKSTVAESTSAQRAASFHQLSVLPSSSNIRLNRRDHQISNSNPNQQSLGFRKRVQAAVRGHKIFLCHGHPIIAEALLKRGWVRKNKLRREPSVEWFTSTSRTQSSSESNRAWLDRTLQYCIPTLIWAPRSKIPWRDLQANQIVSAHPRAGFTTKDGLLHCLRRLHWHTESNKAVALTPRTYRLCDDEERAVFIADYRLTACMGILKWLVGTFEEEGLTGIMDEAGTVSRTSVDFSIQRIKRYTEERRHEDLDYLKYPFVRMEFWHNVIRYLNELLFFKGKLQPIHPDAAQKLYENSKRTLQEVAPFWNLHVDGTHNVWIFKPARRSNGVGLMVTNSLNEIFDLVDQSKSKYGEIVVQKYLERPLLIYNTKFDIRQWFLVADWQPLTIWMYKESYIRFSTQPFTTENFNRSIHLCNNSVQKRFQVSLSRDPNLPPENMWDHYTFRAYLETLKSGDCWETNIYPLMKQAIVGVMLTFQEETTVRHNSFEIYGADFILDEEQNPWLLEINAGPTMSPSTNVTKRLCRQFQEDVIKLIIDRRENPHAEVGMFELAYKQAPSHKSSSWTGQYSLRGRRLKLKKQREPTISTSIELLGALSSYSIEDSENSGATHGVGFVDLVSRFNLQDIRHSLHNRLNDQTEEEMSPPSSLFTGHSSPIARDVHHNSEKDYEVHPGDENHRILPREKPTHERGKREPSEMKQMKSYHSAVTNKVNRTQSRTSTKNSLRSSRSRASASREGSTREHRSPTILKNFKPASFVTKDPLGFNKQAIIDKALIPVLPYARVGEISTRQHQGTKKHSRKRSGGAVELKDILPQLSASQYNPSDRQRRVDNRKHQDHSIMAFK